MSKETYWERFSVLQRAVCCSVLQCAVCCSVFQCAAVKEIHWLSRRTATHCNIETHCNTLQHTATHCNTLQHTATHCNTLQHTASLTIETDRSYLSTRNTLQYTATHCNALQRTATHCNTLQRTATHCNTLHLSFIPEHPARPWLRMQTCRSIPQDRGRCKWSVLQCVAVHCSVL